MVLCQTKPFSARLGRAGLACLATPRPHGLSNRSTPRRIGTAGLPIPRQSTAPLAPAWVCFHPRACPPGSSHPFSRERPAGLTPENELHPRPRPPMLPSVDFDGLPHLAKTRPFRCTAQGPPIERKSIPKQAHFRQIRLATTRCELDSDCSLITSCAQLSRPADVHGTRQNRKMAYGPDIQRDRAACSAVARKVSFARNDAGKTTASSG